VLINYNRNAHYSFMFSHYNTLFILFLRLLRSFVYVLDYTLNRQKYLYTLYTHSSRIKTEERE